MSETSERYLEKASQLVGARPAEIDQWAHKAKSTIIANALQRAHDNGRKEMREYISEMVLSCLARDPSLKLLADEIKEIK